MISLILPYWNRQAAADRALALLAQTYAGAGIEVVVVDDGSPMPFACPDVDLNVRVIRMPQKCWPLSPVTPWNVGVREAAGDVIALSCIEVLHEEPVLEQLAQELEQQGPLGYVLAAAWCPELAEWHCHSQHRSAGAPALPEGCGRSFCAVLNRSLYEAVGGFDEAYRTGAGYEDMDFVHRLRAARAKFVIRDDLVVVHPKSGATTKWGAGMFERNERLYRAKWGMPC
jgi:hypothetical protein